MKTTKELIGFLVKFINKIPSIDIGPIIVTSKMTPKWIIIVFILGILITIFSFYQIFPYYKKAKIISICDFIKEKDKLIIIAKFTNQSTSAKNFPFESQLIDDLFLFSKDHLRPLQIQFIDKELSSKDALLILDYFNADLIVCGWRDDEYIHPRFFQNTQSLPSALESVRIKMNTDDICGYQPSECIESFALLLLGKSYAPSETLSRTTCFGFAQTKLYKVAMNINNSTIANSLFIADLFFELKEYDFAAPLYKDIISKEETSSNIYYQAMFNLAVSYMNIKKYDDAIALLNACKKINYNDSDVLANLGIINFLQGNYLLSRQLLEDAINMNKKNCIALLYLGILERLERNFDQSILCFKNVINIAPLNEDAYVELIDTLMSIGKYRDALDTLSDLKAFSTKPVVYHTEANIYLVLDETKKAILCLEKYLQNNHPDVLTMLMLASYHAKMGDISNSLKVFKKASKLAKETDDYCIHFYKGIIEAYRKRYHQAEQAFLEANEKISSVDCVINLSYIYFTINNNEKSIAILEDAAHKEKDKSKIIQILYALAKIQQNCGDVKDALSNYQKMQNMGYSSSEVHYNMGKCYELLGAISESEINYELAYEKNNQYIDSLINLFYLYKHTGERKKMDVLSEKIIIAAEKLDNIEGMPKIETFYINVIGLMYLEMDKAEIGLPYFRKAEKINNSPCVTYNLALAIKKIGNDKGAMKYLKLVTKQEPNFCRAWNTMASIYYNWCEYDNALMCSNRAIEIDNNNAIYYNTRAAILEETGNLQNAFADCLSAYKLEPYNPTIQSNYIRMLGIVYNKPIIRYGSSGK
ncbi:MAG: tetratricopeptide repeat protein [Sedimentisphaerales bacterium]|nr:tetratricopeptide repeat protein [Sedimentisphaerales bacterium]